MKKQLFACVAVIAVALICLGFGPTGANAQDYFGKNKVRWYEIHWKFYRSSHFNIYHSMDLRDSFQKSQMERMVGQLEGAYAFLSREFGQSLRQRTPVVIYRTHSGFEANFIVGDEFMEEGTGAFAEPMRRRMVGKLDFIPPLNDTIIAHELAHIFQFSFSSGMSGILGSVMRPRPIWFMEGMADFLGSKFAPYPMDNIRNMDKRVAASNPEKFLPTIEDLSAGKGHPYIHGSMKFEFVEGRFGEDARRRFSCSGLSNKNLSLSEVLKVVTDGVIDSAETFDRLDREYWKKKYAQDALNATDPYEGLPDIPSRPLVPRQFPYPIVSAVPSPDGTKMAGFSFQKNGLTLVSWDAPQVSEKPAGQTQQGKLAKPDNGADKIKARNLTPAMPPIPLEYPIAQGLNTWPFSGSDLAWSPDGKQIVFFARWRKDHALCVVDVEKRKIVRQTELSLDQALSPVFDPTGESVYFSAAKDYRRDIYRLNLRSGELTNITQDNAFDLAPAVAPDGKQIAYVAYVGDYQKLFLRDLQSGEKRQLTFGRHNDASPSFSPDGKLLAYSSDENNGVWNIRTLEIASGAASYWTNVFGGAFTPHFTGNGSDRLVYTAYIPYDQFRSYIYANYEPFEARLKTPLRTAVLERPAAGIAENYEWSFRSELAAGETLDGNQLRNPERPPKKWQVTGRNLYLGTSTYWGVFGFASIGISDILEQERYGIQLAMNGNFFRLVGFGYLNQTERRSWGYEISNLKIPLYYLAYGISEGSPRQPVLLNTVGEEWRATAFSFYPLDKFNRLEGQAEIRQRSFKMYGDFGDDPLAKFLDNSEGWSFAVSGAFVRDTVLYSQNTQGPLHGNALRIGLSFAPPMPGRSDVSFVSANVDARRYQRLSDGIVAAARVAGLWSSSPNGDYILLGGPGSLRGYPYGGMVGNQVVYGSVELRFPFVDAIVFPAGIAIGPFRGVLFADAGLAKFNREKLGDQHGMSTGFVFQFLPFNFSWSWRKIDQFKDMKFDFYLGYNF